MASFWCHVHVLTFTGGEGSLATLECAQGLVLTILHSDFWWYYVTICGGDKASILTPILWPQTLTLKYTADRLAGIPQFHLSMYN